MLTIAIRSKPLATLLLNPEFPVLLLVLAASLVYLYRHGPDPRIDRFLSVTALVLPLHAFALFAAHSVTWLRPEKLDLYVYRVDGLLGFQPSFLLGRLVAGRIPLMLPLALAYQLLPFAIVAVFGAYLWRAEMREAMAVLRVFVLNLLLGVPFYLLIPVCGPGYAFPSYPLLPDHAVVPHPIALNAPPNGVPSIHCSTALLVWWFARKLPYGRPLGAVYFLLTAAATLSSGEHYLFDLVAALPYAALVCRLGRLKWPLAAPSALVGQQAQ